MLLRLASRATNGRLFVKDRAIGTRRPPVPRFIEPLLAAVAPDFKKKQQLLRLAAILGRKSEPFDGHLTVHLGWIVGDEILSASYGYEPF